MAKNGRNLLVHEILKSAVSQNEFLKGANLFHADRNLGKLKANFETHQGTRPRFGNQSFLKASGDLRVKSRIQHSDRVSEAAPSTAAQR